MLMRRHSPPFTTVQFSFARPTYTSFNRLFLIPASRVPLRRIFIDDKNILLAYANGKARVWNVETCEFRRSTGLDAAEDMLQSGNWVEMCAAP
jgi:hypothetical protein